MKTLRFPAHLVLQLLQHGSATHLSSPLYTPDATLIPPDIDAVPEPGNAGAAFAFPHETLVLYAPTAPHVNIGVKERWRVGSWKEGHIAVDYAADGHARREWLPVREPHLSTLIRQSCADLDRAGYTPDEDGRYTWVPGQAPTRWRKPDGMRIGLSRLAAVVTHVRPVRISALTELDALNAGMNNVSEHWLWEHFLSYVLERDRAQLENATSETPTIIPSDAPTPLERLHAELRRRYQLTPHQDAWIWATDVQRLDQTPLEIRRQEVAQQDSAKQ